jgi:hypothetical protein
MIKKAGNNNLCGNNKMSGGLPKKVVFKKPNIKKPIELQPENKIHAVDKPQPKVPEPVIEIMETQVLIPTNSEELEIPVKKKSKRILIIQKEPEPVIIIKEPPKQKTFDEKFLEKLNIKSRITKDNVTLEKLQKNNVKPIRKSKVKRKLNSFIVISLIFFIIVTIWTYKIITDYLTDTLDGSLASFMYIIAMILLTIIIFVWFIIEILQRG